MFSVQTSLFPKGTVSYLFKGILDIIIGHTNPGEVPDGGLRSSMTDNIRVENAVTLSRTYLRDDSPHKTEQHK